MYKRGSSINLHFSVICPITLDCDLGKCSIDLFNGASPSSKIKLLLLSLHMDLIDSGLLAYLPQLQGLNFSLGHEF